MTAALASVTILLAQIAPVGGDLLSNAWVKLPGRPSQVERRCARYSEMFWTVSRDAHTVRAEPMSDRAQADPVPFRYTPGPDRDGYRYVAAVHDGWVVGFDDGEFGGGLWWFSPDGRTSLRIRPEASSPVNPEDIFRAENVLGLPEVAGERLVLMGLDHLGGRSGRIFRLVHGSAGGWRLAPVAVLDSQPAVWLVENPLLLFVTESGVWSVGATGDAVRLHDGDLGGFSPTSLVRGPDGALYLGLRHYVLRLESQAGHWSESWYAPSDCLNVRLKDYKCECLRPSAR
jgi:hypothetical protein